MIRGTRFTIHDLRFKNKRRGFSLIELVVYAALVAVVGGLVINLMIPMYRAGVEARISRQINASGALMMERILRETKDADAILVASSTFGVNPSTLVLSTSNASTTGGTMKFALSGVVGRLTFGDLSYQALTSAQTKVTDLTFWRVASSTSEGVRVKITIVDTATSSTRARTFYGSAVLRGSYITK